MESNSPHGRSYTCTSIGMTFILKTPYPTKLHQLENGAISF